MPAVAPVAPTAPWSTDGSAVHAQSIATSDAAPASPVNRSNGWGMANPEMIGLVADGTRDEYARALNAADCPFCSYAVRAAFSVS